MTKPRISKSQTSGKWLITIEGRERPLFRASTLDEIWQWLREHYRPLDPA